MIPAKEFEGELWIKAADFHMQKKEWVGLTEKDIVDCFDLMPPKFARAIEAKLKEKNT